MVELWPISQSAKRWCVEDWINAMRLVQRRHAGQQSGHQQPDHGPKIGGRWRDRPAKFGPYKT